MFIPTWAVVVAVAAVGWFVVSRRQSKAAAELERAMDVAVPILGSHGVDDFRATSQVDFRRMILFEERSTLYFHQLRLWDLRRSDGPRWEHRETQDSHAEYRRHLATEAESGMPMAVANLEEFDAQHSTEWRPVEEWQNLERLHQEYLVELGRGNRAPDTYDPISAAKQSKVKGLERVARLEAHRAEREAKDAPKI